MMGFTTRKCERCGGVMMPKQSEIKLDKDRVVVEVAWICVNCGAVRGALIGAEL